MRAVTSTKNMNNIRECFKLQRPSVTLQGSLDKDVFNEDCLYIISAQPPFLPLSLFSKHHRSCDRTQPANCWWVSRGICRFLLLCLYLLSFLFHLPILLPKNLTGSLTVWEHLNGKEEIWPLGCIWVFKGGAYISERSRTAECNKPPPPVAVLMSELLC